MRLNEIFSVLEKVAPKSLSEEYCEKYGAYDNSGILLDAGEEITGVVFSLDLSFQAIARAVEEKANLIITHHPAIYGKISDIRVSDFSPLGEKIVQCLRHGISVIALHLNLDCAIGGIDERLMRGVQRATGTEEEGNGKIMHPLSVGGYGRAYAVQETSLGVFAENLKREFSTERIVVYGNIEKKITRVASFCGAGADEGAVEFATNEKADVIVSSDFKHHILSLANEKGLAVVVLPHYASENYGFYQFYKKIFQSLFMPCVYHTDKELL